jgi:hypothetical protein
MNARKHAIAFIVLLLVSGCSTVLQASVADSYHIPTYGTIRDSITVILRDDFEDPTLNLNWYKFNNPGYDGSMERSTLDSYSGVACMNITSPAAPWQKTEASRRYIPYPNHLKVGFEFRFKIPYLTKFGSIDFFLVYFNDTVEREAGFELINYYDDGNLYITYLQPEVNGVGHYVSTGKFLYVYSNTWYHVKAIADLNKCEYVSVQVNDLYVDLRGTPINIFSHSEPEEFWVAVACMPESGAYENKTILIDNVFVTNESP